MKKAILLLILVAFAVPSLSFAQTATSTKVSKAEARKIERMEKREARMEKASTTKALKMEAREEKKLERSGNASSTKDTACVGTAVGVREDAVISAFNKFNTAVVSAMTSLKTSLTSAWSKTEKKERNEARKDAWVTFKKSKKSAGDTYKSEKKVAWETFRNTDKNTCKSPDAASEEKESPEPTL
jgi:NACalpha-BTF3-like transcription factor